MMKLPPSHATSHEFPEAQLWHTSDPIYDEINPHTLLPMNFHKPNYGTHLILPCHWIEIRKKKNNVSSKKPLNLS